MWEIWTPGLLTSGGHSPPALYVEKTIGTGMEPWEIGWLAGIIDGEGNISLVVGRQYTNLTHTFSCFFIGNSVGVTNVNKAIVSKVKELYRELDIKYNTHGIQITVNRQYDIAKLLLAVRPYLVGKRDQADMMLRYLLTRTKSKKYTVESKRAVLLLRSMKHTPRPFPPDVLEWLTFEDHSPR